MLFSRPPRSALLWNEMGIAMRLSAGSQKSPLEANGDQLSIKK